MKVSQIRWSEKTGWGPVSDFFADIDLVLVFADNNYFQTEDCYIQLQEMFPQAHIIGCSTSGNVMGVTISDGDVIATAVQLERSNIKVASINLDSDMETTELGVSLMAKLAAPDLHHVIVFSDSQQVNGSDLAKGLNQAGIPVSGGLAGDGARFGKTWVMVDAPARSRCIAALGFYGDVTIKNGCFAGWEEFGAERTITKSEGNVIYEIDDEPALDLYKRYLGEQAKELPASGLQFPLSIQATKADKAVIRTLLAVDETVHSLTFAGDTPQGYLCRLMHTNLDNLIESAGLAAAEAQPASQIATGICLLVSCVGRRLVMGQMTEDELDIVQEKLGTETFITGFYSYGELAPFSDAMQCQLHNQTMTLTTIYE
jgi:hypothetical protein